MRPLHHFITAARAWIVIIVATATVGIIAPARAALVLRYSFDEATTGTTNAKDTGAIAPPLDGKFYGIANRTTDTPGNKSSTALDLSAAGAGSVGTIDGSGNPDDADKTDTLGKMTITFWMNLKGDPGAATHIISGRTAPGAAGGDGWWDVGFAAVGGIVNKDRFRIQFGVGSNNNIANIISANSDGIGPSAGNGSPWDASDAWVFVAVTYDSTQSIANAVKMYIGNASSVPTLLASGGASGTPAAPTQNLTDLRLGIDARFNTDATRKTPGYLDDVRVYNEIRSDLDTIRLAVLPEPTSAAGVIAGLVMLAARQRSRR